MARKRPSTQPVEPAPVSPLTRARGRRGRGTILGIAGAIALIAVLVLGGLLVVPRLLSGGDQKTIWQNITAGINDGKVPKQTALEAFAYVYKVSIPGVTVPGGVNAKDVPTSGSGVLRWVQAHWNELTPAQQAAVNKAVAPQPNDKIFNLDATTGKITGAARSVERPVGSVAPPAAVPLAMVAPIGRPQTPGRAAVDQALADAMVQDLKEDIVHIGQRLGIPPIYYGTGSGPWSNVQFDITEADGGNALMTTNAAASQVHYYPCHIIAYFASWANESVVNGGVSARLHVLLTHEVVHCYQYVVAGNLAAAGAIPTWISEGSAIYLAAEDTQTSEDSLPYQWSLWFNSPETPLTNRSYDAIGWYSDLKHVGRDLWGTIAAAWKAGDVSSQQSNAFVAYLNGDEPDARAPLASSFLRQPGWGADWDSYGFGIPAGQQVKQHDVVAYADTGWTGSLPSRANTVLNVTSAQGELVLVQTDGFASVHDGGGRTLMDFRERTFCVNGDCTCPAGTLLAGKKFGDQELSMPFTAAFNSSLGGSQYALIAFKLEDLCGKKPTPQPSVYPQNPKPPCAGASCGRTNGDPHLTTIDSYHYDFQAAGEFTLLRSPDGKLEIQGRQEPWSGDSSSPGGAAGGTHSGISTNTAIAALDGGHKVGVYVVSGALQVRVDGQVANVAGPLDLGGGAKVLPVDKGYEIDFPDGTRLWALTVGSWGINAIVLPSASLRKSGTGLLGTVIPGAMNVPAMRDGTRLPAVIDRKSFFDALYGRFADSWRVTDSTTLFDYESGKTAATYAIKGFPPFDQAKTILDLTPDQLAAGQSACAGVADPLLQQDCVFDVTASGDKGFAGSYATLNALFIEGPTVPTIASPTPIASPAAPTPGASISGNAFAIMPVTDLGGYTASPDGRLYASVGVAGGAPGAAAIVAIDTSTGKVLAQVAEPVKSNLHFAAGSVWADGIVNDSNGHPCTVTRLDPATLAVQATVNVPCDFFGNASAVSDGDAVWYMDVSRYDGGTGKGAFMVRIDPATNQPGATKVELPFLGGYLKDSYGAFFYYDTGTKGVLRLVSGATTFDNLGPRPNSARFGAKSMWSTTNDGKTASHYSSAATPDGTVPVGGLAVAGDDTAAYVEVQAPDGSDQLWRYPLDGSTPTALAAAPTIGDQGSLGYFADPPMLTSPQGLAKLWLVRGSAGLTLYLQWVPLI